MTVLDEHRKTLLELSFVYLGGIVALFISEALALLGGVIAENRGTFAAAYFLLIPVLVLKKRSIEPSDFGIHAYRVTHSVLWALVVAIVVFPLYTVGYAIWSNVVGSRSIEINPGMIRGFSYQFRNRPDLSSAPNGLHVWTEGGQLFIANTGTTQRIIGLEGCDGPILGFSLRGQHARSAGQRRIADAHTFELEPGSGIRCVITEGRLTFEGEVLLGASSVVRKGPNIEISRTPWWLLELLFIQLIGVALPEEVFYRGYIQSRLAPLFKRRLYLLGATVGPEVVLASALFAFSHLVVIPAPFRLAVFFPGLLFGWIRNRTGSVISAAILHAMSNVLMEFLVNARG